MNAIIEHPDSMQIYDKAEAIAVEYAKRKEKIVQMQTIADELEIRLRTDFLAELKKQTWRQILDETNAQQWMSSKQWNKITDELYNKPKDLPDIDVEGLRSWLGSLIVSSPDMIRELMKEAFDILTPQYREHWDTYKTNEDKREIPKSGKVILRWMCEERFGYAELTYSSNQEMNVLDRAFALLAGRAKPEKFDETTEGKASIASQNRETTFETFWGILKMHKNGNLHITLTKPDLVKKLVEVAAGKTLTANPPHCI